MVVSKSVSRRILWLFSLIILFSVIGLTLSALRTINQLCLSVDKSQLGSVAVFRAPLLSSDAVDQNDALMPPASAIVPMADSLGYVLRYGEDGAPSVVAYPSILDVYDLTGDVVADQSPFVWRNIAVVVALLLFGVMVVLLAALAVQVIRGMRSDGLLFTRRSVLLLRWLALLMLFYNVINFNLFSAFESWVVADLFSQSSPFELTAYLRLDWWMVVLPLLMALFAEFMVIANQLNEEECDTL